MPSCRLPQLRQLIEIVGLHCAAGKVDQFDHVRRARDVGSLLPLVPSAPRYTQSRGGRRLGQTLQPPPIPQLVSNWSIRHANEVTCEVTLDNCL